MRTYKITTTNGTITARGDNFQRVDDDLTGEHHGYDVTLEGELVAHIQGDAFVSVEVKPSDYKTVAVF